MESKKIGFVAPVGPGAGFLQTNTEGIHHHPFRARKISASRTCMTSSYSNNSKVKVLVVGGTGRVGFGTAKALLNLLRQQDQYSQLYNQIEIVLAGRDSSKGEMLAKELAEISHRPIAFAQINVNDSDSLKRAMQDARLVIHTAGPFQSRLNPCDVLQAAIEMNVACYMDVCDDVSHSRLAQEKYHELAVKSQTKCLISTGIYPGISNIMVVEAIEVYKQEAMRRGISSEPTHVQLNYYTAGSGNAGETILKSTFLLLAEEAVYYQDGQVRHAAPASLVELVDFGQPVGKKQVYALNLPEVVSLHENLGIPNIVAKFCTDPEIWNWLLRLTPKLIPKSLLTNLAFINVLAKISYPVVQLVDRISGSAMIIQVQVYSPEHPLHVSNIYAHPNLEECVGLSTAAFASSLLDDEMSSVEGGMMNSTEDVASTLLAPKADANTKAFRNIPCGVWYPEQIFNSSSGQQALLSLVMPPGEQDSNTGRANPKEYKKIEVKE